MFNLNYYGAGTLIYHVKCKDEVYVFLGCRKNYPDKGLWSIPGGGWEKEDGKINGKPDYVETARRELREETGFYLSSERRNLMHKIWSVHFGKLFNFEVFVLRAVRMKVPYSYYEFSDVKWFNINKLPDKNECSMFLYEQIKSLKKFLVKKGHLSKI